MVGEELHLSYPCLLPYSFVLSGQVGILCSSSGVLQFPLLTSILFSSRPKSSMKYSSLFTDNISPLLTLCYYGWHACIDSTNYLFNHILLRYLNTQRSGIAFTANALNWNAKLFFGSALFY